MRSGARRAAGSRFPEGGGQRALVAPPQNGCSGRACAAARAGGVVRVSRRGRAARAGGPAGYARGRRGVVARRVAAVPVCPPFRDRSRGGREVGAVPPVAGGCCEAGLCRCGRRGAAVPGSYARGRRRRWPGGFMQEGAEGRRFRRVAAVPVCPPFRDRSPGVAVKRGCVAVRRVAVKRGLRRCGRRGAAVPGGYAIGRRGAMARRVMQEGAGARRPKVVVKRGLRRWPPGVVVKRGCAVVDGGARQFRGVMREDGGGRRFRGGMREDGGGRRFRGVMREGGASRGNWYALFPEGKGGARRVARPRNGCSGRACAAARAGGLCKRAQGTAARRVAAVPVCPPFRDRSRGGREVGAAPPVAGGCCEAGLHRCGWRGAAVPGSYARGRRDAAVPAGYARGRRGAAVPGDCARGRRGRRPGGWLPCRFVRHFVTGRGVAVKWGLRRRSPGVAVKRGCTAVDGGARQFRGVMQEGAEGRRFRRVAAVPVCPPFRDRSSGVAVKRVCVALSGCPPLVGSNGGCAADRRGLL